MDAYVEFTGMNPTQLIDEAEADREKKVRDRGAPKQRLLKFREWLIKEYRQKTRGSRKAEKKRKDKIGVSENLANMYCAAMKGFYRDNGFKLDVKFGKAQKKKENFKLIVRSAEISKLLSAATSLRDRAIVKFMYESTQGVSEVCSPNYGDIKRYNEDGMEIWQFHLIRKKTGTEFYTEIGEECIELLNLYFAERQRNGEKLTEPSPLFVKEGAQKFTRQRITTNLIEGVFKTLAIKSGLVTEEQMARADINPCRPHALRAGGMSVLKLAGCNGEAVEFRAGHELTEQRQAYWLTRPDELRKLFREHYDALRVKGTTPFDTQEVQKLRSMLAEKEITVQALAENGKVKVAMIQQLRKELEGLKTTVENLAENFSKNVKVEAQNIHQQWLHEQYEADREAIRDLQKWREEFAKRYEREVKQPSPKPKSGKEKISEKIIKIEEPKKVEPKPKPKKELSWHELIYGEEETKD